ncbi:MAG: hypothetical protein KIT69_15375 [Propionibacteriaceae bacterium]|nr:hypothetical protein [Propionibacteriaceae bacterium]
MVQSCGAVAGGESSRRIDRAYCDWRTADAAGPADAAGTVPMGVGPASRTRLGMASASTVASRATPQPARAHPDRADLVSVTRAAQTPAPPDCAASSSGRSPE